MVLNTRWNAFVSPPLTLLAVFALASAPVQAQVKPLKVVGAGVGPDGLPLPGQAPRSHWIVGTATHLGKHYGEGTVRTDTAEFQPNGTITGEFGSGSPFVFVGANGDKLACYYGRTDFGASEPGTFTLTIVDVLGDGSLVVEALWIAEFVVQPELSNGKFAGGRGVGSCTPGRRPSCWGPTTRSTMRGRARGPSSFRRSRGGRRSARSRRSLGFRARKNGQHRPGRTDCAP